MDPTNEGEAPRSPTNRTAQVRPLAEGNEGEVSLARCIGLLTKGVTGVDFRARPSHIANAVISTQLFGENPKQKRRTKNFKQVASMGSAGLIPHRAIDRWSNSGGCPDLLITSHRDSRSPRSE